jgi:hypothetical protein
MTVTFTISKRLMENQKTVMAAAQEVIAENVAGFVFDEARQRVHISYNDGKSEIIELCSGNEEKSEQWFLMDIKCLQVPLKVQL